MQENLFSAPVEVDFDADPYEEKRVAAGRLATEFLVGQDEAFDLVLGFGSEAAARGALMQRWWRGEVELRSAA